MKKKLHKLLASVVTGGFVFCNLGLNMLQVSGAQVPTVIDTNPAMKDCLSDANLFGTNPGVEGGSWWESSHNWTCGAFSLDTNVKHSGQSSLKYSEAEANWDNTLFAPDITVKANTDYTFSFWVKGEEQGDVFGSMLSGNDKIGNITLSPASWDGQWHQVGFTFNTGDVTTIRFALGSGGGTAYFDDFKLFEAGATYILTTNPEFLDASEGNNLFGSNPGIEGDEWWGSSHNWNCDAYSLDTLVKHSGSSSLKYSEPAANWDNGLYAPDITVKAYTDYTFSFWINGEVQGGVFGCMLTGNNKIGGEVTLSPPVWDGTWKQVGYTFNTGKYTSIRFTIGPGGGTAYFDDFQLFETSKADIPEREAFIVTTSPESMDSAPENNIFGTNPGLEGDSWWKSSHNWTCDAYSQVTDIKHSGNSSLKYSEPAANWDNGLYAPDIAVKANTNYTFSFWVKGEVQGGVFGCMLTGNNKIGGEVTLVPPVWDGTWKQVGYTFNTGKHTVIRFTIGPGGGTAYFDDFQLFETSKANPPVEREASIVTMSPTAIDCADGDNLFGSNAGVESDTWWKDGYKWDCGSYTRVQDTKHSGEYSLRYSDGSPNWDNGYYAPDFQVKANTNYTFSVWVKGEVQGDGFVCMLTGNNKIGGEYYLSPKLWNGSWHQIAYTFNTGKHTVIRMHFGAGGGTIYYDDFKLFEESKGVVPPPKDGNDPEGRRAVFHEITCKAEDNLITDPSCDETNYWNTDAQGYGKALSVSADKPYQSQNSLKFAATGDSYIKWLDVEKDTDYYFSLMVSADPAVLGDIKYYMVDSNGGQIENKFTENEATNYVLRGGVDTVLHVPSWDGNWYNRIYRFNTGRETKIGIKIVGNTGTLYFDEIQLFKVDKAVLIREPESYGITLEINPEKSICAEADNLIENGTFEEGSRNWDNITGYGKFMSVQKKAGNNVLYYNGIQSHAYYLSWFTVKTNTEYTLSYYVQVLKGGEAEAGVLDGSPEKRNLGEPQLLSEVNGWKHYAVTFNSDNLDKVAFYVYDGGGQAAFDKIRLFEEGKGIIPTSADIPVDIPVDNESPDTGDIPVQAAMALLTASAGVVLKLKKRNNQ